MPQLPAPPESVDPARAIALAQGAYYTLTGIWPLVSIRTFEMVTGRKKEKWLVKTVGALVGVVGGALLASARRGRPSGDLVAVAAGSAAVLATVDVVYVAKDRIAPIYLLDAVAEAALLAGWAFALSGGRGPGGEEGVGQPRQR